MLLNASQRLVLSLRRLSIVFFTGQWLEEIDGLVMIHSRDHCSISFLRCAFHCFNGSCSKCSRFTTRVFNQVMTIVDCTISSSSFRRVSPVISEKQSTTMWVILPFFLFHNNVFRVNATICSVPSSMPNSRRILMQSAVSQQSATCEYCNLPTTSYHSLILFSTLVMPVPREHRKLFILHNIVNSIAHGQI